MTSLFLGLEIDPSAFLGKDPLPALVLPSRSEQAFHPPHSLTPIQSLCLGLPPPMLIRTVTRFALFALLLFCVGCNKESQAIVFIALHPTNADILYVATNDSVYKSRDGGQLWERTPG